MRNIFVHPSLVALRDVPAGDVGEAIPVASLRPIRTARKPWEATLELSVIRIFETGGMILERRLQLI